MKILTAAQMQRIDRITTERYGIPSLTLMENAGRGVAEYLAARFAPLERHQIVILCGKGNNGGDGLVVAVDLMEAVAGARVVAVDLPSGLSADSGELIGECVRADASVTFTAPKIAHVFPPACERVGKWVTQQIGTPPEALEQDPELFLNLTCCHDVAWVSQPRKIDAHKGSFGHVLILAGSVGKTGAAALAARAALRAGAGLATVATAESALPVIASLGMEFMTEPLPETDSGPIPVRALAGGRPAKLVE